MEVKKRKRRQQIRDELIAERLKNIYDKKLLNISTEPQTKEREEGSQCSAESCKKK